MPALAQETEEKDGSASSGSLPTVEVKASAMQATTGMELSMPANAAIRHRGE